MEESKQPKFHDGLVTLTAEEHLAVHEENFTLRRRNIELQTALVSIKETIARVGL